MAEAPAGTPRLLCVDDDPAVLAGLALQLGREFDFRSATNAEEALNKLVAEGPFAVVLSDYHMPGMDGAALLARVREIAPDTARILLTGYNEMESAIAAVNEGRIFRLLAKPCAPSLLRRAVRDGVEHQRLLSAERELLERTLRGAVQALAEVLALSDPDAFGRAGRVQRLALNLADRLGLQPRWPLELAALLSQIGTVSLPAELVKKLRYGDPLEADEALMVARLPEVTDKLLAHIPRLERVREILLLSRRPNAEVRSAATAREQKALLRAAAILRLADEFDLLESRGLSAAQALSRLRMRSEAGDDEILDALEQATRGAAAGQFEVRELPLRLLQVGMVLAEDLLNRAGLLLAPRGSEITASFVERARNFPPGAAREPVRVMLPVADKPKPQEAAVAAS